MSLPPDHVTIVVRSKGVTRVYRGRCVVYAMRKVAKDFGWKFRAPLSRSTKQWPPEAVTYLQRARAANVPFSAIARELTNRFSRPFTKSACIGFYHRSLSK